MWRLFDKPAIDREAPIYRLTPGGARSLFVAPVALTGGYVLLLLLPWTHYAAIRLLDENGPVELLTFVAALAGGLVCIRTAVLAGRSDGTILSRLFYALFAAGMIFIAGEEIAWGQQFFRFPTPESWRALNAQGETTLHNLAAIQGHTELIRLVFGLGGLAGVWVSRLPRFRSVGAPRLLVLWFAVIAGHSVVDAANDLYPVSTRVDFYINKFSEMIEMFIGIAGLAYAWLNARMLAAPAKE